MNNPTAILYWNLHVSCPRCSCKNDLADGYNYFDPSIKRNIFSIAQENLVDTEVTCESCGHEFEIGRVEY